MHSTVTVEAISKRLGKTMGFSQCELRDENGAVVAYGTHTKFLGITGPKL
jgi:acyl-coenzyme A thioesterase PaaI-like protein